MIEQPLAVPSTATASRQAERCLMGLGILGGFGHLAGRQRHTGCRHQRPHRRPPSQVSVESVRPVEKTLPVLRRLAARKARASCPAFLGATASKAEVCLLPPVLIGGILQPGGFRRKSPGGYPHASRWTRRGGGECSRNARRILARRRDLHRPLAGATTKRVRRRQTGRGSARCSGHRSRSCWRAPAGRVPHGRHWECSRGRSQGRGSRN